ncbi:hypothetical protein GCM10009765_68420 [Fodinicola feengrottensis]|uniref:ABC transporter permease n=1 Tax=Fodinicola feengrottensis TaxID=435914 RepID=A0ABP4UTM4_9ACTN
MDSRQLTRTAGVTVVLSLLLVLLTLLFLYAFPFFANNRIISLTSTNAMSVAAGIGAAAVSLLVLGRLRQLPAPVATILVSLAVGFVPAAIAGGVVIVNTGAPQGFAVLLNILIGALIYGLVALVRPIQVALGAVMVAVFTALAFRFVGALTSTILLHWLVYGLQLGIAELQPIAIGINVVVEVLATAICVAAIVPGVVRSAAVAGHPVRAGLLVGLLPGGLSLVIDLISWLPVLLFPTDGDGSTIDFWFTVGASAGYALVGTSLGALIGVLVALVARPARIVLKPT